MSKSLMSSIPIVVLGALRLASVKLSGYHEHVSEYGLHWNFFFTMASVKVKEFWRKKLLLFQSKFRDLLQNIIGFRFCLQS